MFIEDLKKKAAWLYGGTSIALVIKAAVSDGSLCMLLYRAMSWCDKFPITNIFAMILCKINTIVCGAVIGRGARFGPGFVILHSVGIVINTRVRGGINIYIESGVVIGETKRGCPVMGSNIFVGSGAKIVGEITIGDNVTIGANAVVNKSFPDSVVVGGVPAKILRYKNESEKLIKG